MSAFRVIAISTEAARQVRATLRSPFHELPVQVEVARDDAPCRHCLRKFVVGVDRRILCQSFEPITDLRFWCQCGNPYLFT